MTKPTAAAIPAAVPAPDPYAGVDDATRDFAERHAEAIRVLGRRTAQAVVDIGRLLAEVKARLPHGSWLPWLEHEFGWSERTAQNFLRVHETFGAKSAMIADLPIDMRALYLLAAPSTPAAARKEAVARAEAGERIPHATAQEIGAEAIEGIQDEIGGRPANLGLRRTPVKRSTSSIPKAGS